MPLLAKKRPPKEMTLLMNEINKTKIALEAAYSNFENVVDPDLIDSCIYELNAIQNRYHFLLKILKLSVVRTFYTYLQFSKVFYLKTFYLHLLQKEPNLHAELHIYS